MAIPPLLLQFGGSLIAVLVIAGLVRALGLGRKPVLKDDATVISVAREVDDGFDAKRVSISREGKAALAAGSAGRIMVIKRHGNHFAGRILTNEARVREEVDGLVVDCAEARFGPVRLSVSDPTFWADTINRL